jgi:hypothetical protein
MTSEPDDVEEDVDMLCILFPLAFHGLVDSLNDKQLSDEINLIIGSRGNPGGGDLSIV